MAAVTRYVNCSATASGDGTTNGEGSGGVNAWKSLSDAFAGLVSAYSGTLTDQVTLICSSGTGNAADTVQATITGLTTTATNYLHIKAKVGEEAKSTGFQTDRYRHDTATFANGITIGGSCTHCIIQNLQVRHTRTAGDGQIVIQFSVAYVDGRFSEVLGCWVEAVHTDTSVNSRGISFNGSGAGYVNNTVVKGPTTVISGSIGIYEGFDGANIYLYNATVVKWASGLLSAGDNIVAKNVITTSCTVGFTSGDFDAASNYNATDTVAETPPGANSVNGTFTFTTAYKLDPADATARNAGTDLSGDAEWRLTDVDIDAVARPQGASWDIGASEAIDSSSPRVIVRA